MISCAYLLCGCRRLVDWFPASHDQRISYVSSFVRWRYGEQWVLMGIFLTFGRFDRSSVQIQ